MSRAFGPRFRRGYAAIGLALALFGSAQAAILDNSIALDAVYIPALSLTNAKPVDGAGVDGASVVGAAVVAGAEVAVLVDAVTSPGAAVSSSTSGAAPGGWS